MPKIIAKTYEGRSLVVQHVFFGATLDEAKQVLLAHLKTDSFLNASMKREVKPNQFQGVWNGIVLSTSITYEY